MTRAEYIALWNDPAYVVIVNMRASMLKSDGCTGVPDFYRLGCLEHDVAYRSGKDPHRSPITRREADKRLRWYIQKESAFGVCSLMSWWRWIAVRLFAGKAWKG
mgnify:CR=1 FL=1